MSTWWYKSIWFHKTFRKCCSKISGKKENKFKNKFEYILQYIIIERDSGPSGEKCIVYLSRS